MVVGSLVAALGASVCCLGPVVFSIMGAGALSAVSTRLEPLRPLFIGLTGVFLVTGFFVTYRRSPVESCGPGETCTPAANRTAKVSLWITTFVAVLLVAFPYYVNWLF